MRITGSGGGPTALPQHPPRGVEPRAAAQPRRTEAAAPSGAPPSLWSVLTDEERQFFLGAAAMGPLSYGPSGAKPAAPAAPLGQRIDVRA